ncbi:hypothetical protein ONZ45_g8329 [Pleurotus djamor]|nr:hypothetical protein ONZ45_g8329 [Pleurotus djamor]
MKVDVYSNFFSSGLRAITGRPRKRPTSMYTYPSPLEFTLPEPSSSSRLDPLPPAIDTAPPYIRSPRSSILFAMSPSKPSSSRSSTSPPPPRSRRSSLMALPSRVLNRMSASFASNELPSHKSTTPQTPSGLRRDHTADMSDVIWITEGGPLVAPLTPTSPKLVPIDPFSSSPDTKSVFIDFYDTPSSTPNRESFISFTTSSKSSSLLHLPRRERPTSIQTMPLPTRSRRSSLQYPLPSQDKYDWAWILDEATPIYSPRPPEELEQVDEADEVDPARLDWWQFHNDLVQREDTA